MSGDPGIVFGRIPVLECLRARRRPPRRLYVLASAARGLEEIIAAAAGVPVEETDRAGLDRLAAGGNHQGVVLHAEPTEVFDLVTWLERHPEPDAFAVMLDCVEDPQNFGAVIRSAAAFGAAGVLFGKDRAAPLSPAAVKAAAGGVEHVDLVQVTNLARAVEQMQKAGFWAAALDAGGQKTLWDADLTGRTLVVVGNEGDGIRRLVRDRCDFIVSIPMAGALSSLNASVSAAIALAECRRRRPA